MRTGPKSAAASQLRGLQETQQDALCRRPQASEEASHNPQAWLAFASVLRYASKLGILRLRQKTPRTACHRAPPQRRAGSEDRRHCLLAAPRAPVPREAPKSLIGIMGPRAAHHLSGLVSGLAVLPLEPERPALAALGVGFCVVVACTLLFDPQ